MKAVLRMFIIFCVALIPGGQVFAAYDLKTDFGLDGMITNGFGNYDDQANDIAVQDDGNIIVVGSTENEADTDFGIARYNSNGSLDTTFSADGRATVKVGNGDDAAYGVVVLDDGTIVVVGMTEEDETTHIALVSLTETGYLNLDFGISSQVVYRFDEGSSVARDVVVDSEGRLIVTGTHTSGTETRGVVLRFSKDGSLDTTFGDNGVGAISYDEAELDLSVLALQSDGKIIIGGILVRGDEDKKGVVHRLSKVGMLDSDFGTDGSTIMATEGDSAILGLAIHSDDTILATGYTTNDRQKDITVIKLTRDGEFDTNFGDGGLAFLDLGGDSQGNDITVKDDASLLIGGKLQGDSASDALLVHLDSDGNLKESVVLEETLLDPTATDEENYSLVVKKAAAKPVVTDINGQDDSTMALTITADGQVLAAGASNNGNDDDFALLAYEDPTSTDGLDGTASTTDQLFYVVTKSIFNITRNSAMSGGVISDNEDYDCDNDCEVTVSGRGVVFGITPYPTYSSSSSDDTTTDSTDDSEDSSVFPSWVSDGSHNYNLVRSGQTSDGSGTGTYGSDIREITPEQRYYVRAYALLSDNTVIYGNQLSFVTDDACFIATAAFGSPLDSHVMILRQFRDRYLKTSVYGQKFVALYYSWSPQFADTIEKSQLLRFCVQLALFPLIVFSYFMLLTPMVIKAILIAVLLTSLWSNKYLFSRR